MELTAAVGADGTLTLAVAIDSRLAADVKVILAPPCIFH
jgi:hypothetical protein